MMLLHNEEQVYFEVGKYSVDVFSYWARIVLSRCINGWMPRLIQFHVSSKIMQWWWNTSFFFTLLCLSWGKSIDNSKKKKNTYSLLAGLEPATFRLEGENSIQLSYRSIIWQTVNWNAFSFATIALFNEFWYRTVYSFSCDWWLFATPSILVSFFFTHFLTVLFDLIGVSPLSTWLSIVFILMKKKQIFNHLYE